MNPILKTACLQFEAKMADAFESFVKEADGFFSPHTASKDSTNLKDPSQRASFVASDPNKANYGAKVPGSPAAQAAGKADARPGVEKQEVRGGGVSPADY